MRHRAAHEYGVQHVREREISDELPFACEQATVLAAQDRPPHIARRRWLVHAAWFPRSTRACLPSVEAQEYWSSIGRVLVAVPRPGRAAVEPMRRRSGNFVVWTALLRS